MKIEKNPFKISNFTYSSDILKSSAKTTLAFFSFHQCICEESALGFDQSAACFNIIRYDTLQVVSSLSPGQSDKSGSMN